MTEKSALPEATERSLQILKKQIPAWGEYLLAQRGLSMRTVVSYRQDLENFFLFLDELDAGDKTSLDEHDLFLYLAWLRARKNAGRTAGPALVGIARLFRVYGGRRPAGEQSRQPAWKARVCPSICRKS